MARLIELDALVPDDIIFKLGDAQYAIPGDPDVEMILRLVKLSQRLGDADDAVRDSASPQTTEQAQKAQEDAATELRDELLGLFRIRQPELERLPFGMIALQHVIATIFREVGLVAEESPTRATPPKKAGSRKSGRSTGSPRS